VPLNQWFWRVAIASTSPLAAATQITRVRSFDIVANITVDCSLLCCCNVCPVEDVGVDPSGIIEVRSGEQKMRQHVVLEVLRVHLVSDLRERLPSLHESRKVLHLPPEVQSLVVDG